MYLDAGEGGQPIFNLMTILGSVTRWPYCLFNIWPFTAMTICPIANERQSRVTIFQIMK